jgi:hypothetical protein
LAFFEFAPLSGAGMGVACACTTPTGAKGEALTFTRASNGTCTKGNPTTGIQNGDLVVCSTNQPRVGNPDGAGLALLVESSRQNRWLRSQEFDNASWTKTGITDAAPTVTANFADAPDGTTTAERIQFAATTGAANDSSVEQFISTGAGQLSVSVYVKGNGTSGTIDLCSYATTWACTPCAFVSASWTRCTLDNRAALAVSNYIQLGNVSYHNGGTLRSAADVLVWGAQGEIGSYSTSYIPTTTVAVTRAVDAAATFASPSLASLASTGSAAGTVMPLAAGTLAGGIVIMDTAGRPLYFNGSTARIYDGVTETQVANGAAALTPKRYWSSWTGSTQTVNNTTDGTSTSGAFDGTMTTTGPLAVCASATIGGGDFYCRGVCLDPSPTRCR